MYLCNEKTKTGSGLICLLSKNKLPIVPHPRFFGTWESPRHCRCRCNTSRDWIHWWRLRNLWRPPIARFFGFGNLGKPRFWPEYLRCLENRWKNSKSQLGTQKLGQSARRSAVLFAIFKMHFFTSYPQNCRKRMILDTYHQKLLTCTCAKTWNRALKNECFHQNSLCFPMYLQTPSEIAWISFFPYFPCRLSLQSLPRLLKTWPSLKRRHSPRHRYFHNAISLIFPLDGRLYVTPAYMTTPPHLQTC